MQLALKNNLIEEKWERSAGFSEWLHQAMQRAIKVEKDFEVEEQNRIKFEMALEMANL